MNLKPVPPSIGLAGLRAVHTVFQAVNQNPRLTDLQLQLIQGIQIYVTHSAHALEELQPIEPPELATIVADPHFRERIMSACVIASCIHGAMSTEGIQCTQKFAEAFGVSFDLVKTAKALAEHHLMTARLNIVRRSLPGVKVGQVVHTQGVMAMIRQMLPLFKISLPDVTARYRALESYPEGTLGAEFVRYLKRNGFPFPGEEGAGPEIIVVHDCLHILGDYGTSPSEEIELACFQAGCQTEDPIYGVLFGLAQYHLDVRVAPVAPSQALKADPKRAVAALARGCKVNRDMWRNFEPWDHFHRNIEELRKEFGIEPIPL